MYCSASNVHQEIRRREVDMDELDEEDAAVAAVPAAVDEVVVDVVVVLVFRVSSKSSHRFNNCSTIAP